MSTTGGASWLPDPSGRHQYRYWDGTRWTEGVADNGAQSIDPVGASSLAEGQTAPMGVIPSRPVTAPTLWYEQVWFIVITLLFCFPIGLILVWRKPWQQGVKIAITASVGILFVGVAVAGALSPKTQNNTVPPVVTTTTHASAPSTATPSSPPPTTPRTTTPPTAPPTTRATTPATVPPTTKPTTPPTTSPPAPKVLLDVSGSGITSTQKFDVPSDYDIDYSYNCSDFGSSGNFIVDVQDDSGLLDTAVNELGASGLSVTHEHDGPDTVWLEINSECSWHVHVVPG